MRVLLSMSALGMMVLGFYLILDPAQPVDAASSLRVDTIPVDVALRDVTPPAPTEAPSAGLRIELVGSERFELGDQIPSAAWVAFEPDATHDCGARWPATTVADASGLLGGV
jgi:hypothetical protein